ncbi:hypothetical protein BDR26DRAFT_633698 [Obelidium mucronatum]|nr:hypothetical protein BDR26DRAFT_633698 [Obelidium mucronatum]
MGKRKATSIDDDAVDPNEKHRIANRLAQRAFRERKDNRIKELETQVEELLAAQQTPPAQSANTEKKIREMEESISKLVAENTELKQKLEAAQRHAPQPANNINETLAPATAETTVYSSMHYLEAPTRSMSASVSPMWNVSMAQMTHQSLSPVSNTPSTTTNLSSSSIMKPASALDLYGLPPIESFRAELKALPSLAGCASIDLFFDHFVDQSKVYGSFPNPTKDIRDFETQVKDIRSMRYAGSVKSD